MSIDFILFYAIIDTDHEYSQDYLKRSFMFARFVAGAVVAVLLVSTTSCTFSLSITRGTPKEEVRPGLMVMAHQCIVEDTGYKIQHVRDGLYKVTPEDGTSVEIDLMGAGQAYLGRTERLVCLTA
jgi:hypothetical protein